MSTELPTPLSISTSLCFCLYLYSQRSQYWETSSLLWSLYWGFAFPISLPCPQDSSSGSGSLASQSSITQDSAILTVPTEPIRLLCLEWIDIIDVCKNEDLLGSPDVEHHSAAQLGRTWRALSQHLVKNPFEPPAVPKIGSEHQEEGSLGKVECRALISAKVNLE